MTKHRNTPCEDCPYRVATPLAKWHPSHIEDVRRSAKTDFGAVFQCHKTAGLPPEKMSLCAGYTLDQVAHGVPNISLRLIAACKPEVAEHLNQVHCDEPTYGSALEMVEANEDVYAQQADERRALRASRRRS